MRIRIYHSENGCVRVTKEMDDGNEMTMFSNVKNGKVAIIDIHAPLSLKAELNRIEKQTPQ